MERARVLGFGDHIPVLRPTNPTLLASVKCTDLETLYHAAFTRDPQAFTFVFVGDLPPDEELVPLLEEHLGSLGGGGDAEVGARASGCKASAVLTHVAGSSAAVDLVASHLGWHEGFVLQGEPTCGS